MEINIKLNGQELTYKENDENEEYSDASAFISLISSLMCGLGWTPITVAKCMKEEGEESLKMLSKNE